jgi:phage terminase large subunit-like protein
MRVMAAEAPQLEGLNPTFVIVDEVHALPDDELWNVFALAMGARPDPMMVGITTAGVKYDRLGGESLAYRNFLYGQRVAAKEIDDKSFGMAWWAPKNENSDHKDPKVWREANPGFGDLQSEEDFESAVLRTPEAEFRTKRLNLWVDSAETWMPSGAWERCADEREIPRGSDVVMALDGSWNSDSTALIAVQVPHSDDEKPHITVAGLWERPPNASDEWTVDMHDVEARIRELCRYWNVREVAADPYRLSRTIQDLEDEGIPMTVFPQSAARMTPATANMYEQVMSEGITHDGDKRLARHVSNAVLKVDSRGSRIVKESRGTSKKIDGIVSAIMALDRALWWRNEVKKPKPRVIAF